ICHIIDTKAFSIVEAYDTTVIRRAEKFAEELVHSLQKTATEAGVVDVNCIVDNGSPKVKIVKEIVPKNNVDLIICGATGLNAVERFFMGSVSEHITRYAACDVLVVRG